MTQTSAIYPDEYIDYWGDVFLALELWREGVEFERFLEAPQRFLRQAGLEPLLPAQAEAAARALLGGA